jgi:predicted ATPase
VERHPEVLAQHYAEAGLNDKAVQYWIQAGNRSIARSAMGEAEAQFQKALARIPILPETRERALLELEIQSSLGSLRLAISGFTAPHVVQTYERARELWEQLGCPPEFIRVPWGQFMYHVNRAELTRARVLGESLMDLAELRHDQAALLPARLCMGGLDLACGNFASSRSHLEEAHRIYNPEFQSRFIQTLGIDPHVHVLSFLSLTLLFLGYPDQALARRREGIGEARESNHRPSLAIALSSTSRLLACLGDHCLLAQSAGELVTLATEQGFPYWLRQGEMYQGVAEIRNGETDAGLSRVRNGAAAFQGTGAELWMPIYRAMEAQAETLKDNTDVAMTVLDDALRSSRARGENWFEAELVRRKGELLRNCHPTMAEALFREAIDIAVRQEAKLWELRATVSLAGLYADVGRRNKAYKMLTPVYSWFTEGFDTPDLKEAKALLDELAS